MLTSLRTLLDDLRTLMTVGEVIPARVTATGPDWALTLHDVDDDEPIVSAPSLLPDGLPWLSEEPDRSEVDEPEAPTSLPMPPPAPTPVQVIEAPAPTQPPSAATPRPSPAILDRSRPGPNPRPASTPPAAQRPTESTRGLLFKVDGLMAEIAGLKRDVVNLQTQLLAGTDEREQLRFLLDQAERRAKQAEKT